MAKGPFKSTAAMRARARELSCKKRDDYDRAVIAILDDLDALIAFHAQVGEYIDGCKSRSPAPGLAVVDEMA